MSSALAPQPQFWGKKPTNISTFSQPQTQPPMAATTSSPPSFTKPATSQASSKANKPAIATSKVSA
ncbi:MAG: hypothetical protein ACFCU8_05020 [Thermosynechococcaceae cyanobacterium]